MAVPVAGIDPYQDTFARWCGTGASPCPREKRTDRRSGTASTSEATGA